VADLLGVDTTAANTFPPDNSGLGFTNTPTCLSVTDLLAEAYMTGAETFATAAVAKLATLLPCDPVAAGADVCAKAIHLELWFARVPPPADRRREHHLFHLYTTGKGRGRSRTASSS